MVVVVERRDAGRNIWGTRGTSRGGQACRRAEKRCVASDLNVSGAIKCVYVAFSISSCKTDNETARSEPMLGASGVFSHQIMQKFVSLDFYRIFRSTG
jgi:hypothetical protein